MSLAPEQPRPRKHLAETYPARLLAAALWASTAIGIVVLLSHTRLRPGLWDDLFLGVVVTAAVLGVLVWFRGAVWPAPVMFAVLVLIDALVVVAVLCSRRSPEADLHTLLLLPPALYAAAYLPRRYVRAHEVAIVLASGAAMAVTADTAMQWAGLTAVPVVALIGASELVMALRLSLEQALADLALVSGTDPLTGLLNRRGLQQRLSAPAGSYRAVLMLDVDHFKEVNDTFGHAVGDEVLVTLGEALTAAVVEPDLVARLGGEEFVVVTTRDDESLAIYAERLRRQLGEVLRPWGRSLSVGAAAVGPDDMRANVDLVLRRADQALYAAKALGRDRSVVEGRPD